MTDARSHANFGITEAGRSRGTSLQLRDSTRHRAPAVRGLTRRSRADAIPRAVRPRPANQVALTSGALLDEVWSHQRVTDPVLRTAQLSCAPCSMTTPATRASSKPWRAGTPVHRHVQARAVSPGALRAYVTPGPRGPPPEDRRSNESAPHACPSPQPRWRCISSGPASRWPPCVTTPKPQKRRLRTSVRKTASASSNARHRYSSEYTTNFASCTSRYARFTALPRRKCLARERRRSGRSSGG